MICTTAFETKKDENGEEVPQVLLVGYPGGGAKFKTDYDDFHPQPLTTKAIVAFATKYGLPPGRGSLRGVPGR